MHEEIKRFYLNGEVADNNLVEAKERLIHFIEAGMRDEGYVPELTLEPQFSLNYDAVNEKYDFELSVYGVHVGRERECHLSGVENGRTVMKYIRPVKSSRS